MQINTFPITLERAFMISPKVKHFVFKCDEEPIFDYAPGQFITIHFDVDGKTLRRSYSIANAPQKNNTIEFAAGFVENGPGTNLLFNLKQGDKLSINGPFGRLTLKENDPHRYILVATSTGITPFRAMLNALAQRMQTNPHLEVVILQGIQKKAEILYAQEFQGFVKNYPRAQFRAYLSREQEHDVESHEYLGYVQKAFPELNLNHEQDLIYLCGNPSMIDDAFDYLKNQGFSIQQIIREKYISR